MPGVSGSDGRGRRRRNNDDPLRLGDSIDEVMRGIRPVGVRPSAPSSVMGGVFGRWEEAVGELVAAHAHPVLLDGTTLVVKVDEPAWATQLRFLERSICERLAEVAGAVIERVEIRVDGASAGGRRTPRGSRETDRGRSGRDSGRDGRR